MKKIQSSKWAFAFLPLYFLALDACSKGSGTCENTCAHYLECKGAATANNQSQCMQNCQALGPTTEQLKQIESMNCRDAVATVERMAGGGGGGAGGGGAPAPGGAGGPDCDRCVWDGSSCIWMSPNAPVTPACDASCCPGH